MTASATSGVHGEGRRDPVGAREPHRRDDLPVRLIAPAYTIGVSDGQLNGTDRMRYSLIGRELVNDRTDAHLRRERMARASSRSSRATSRRSARVAALLEHNVPAVILSDGSVHPGDDPATGERLDSSRVPGRGRPRRRGPHARRAARVPGPGQLRGHVHVQHDADVHRRARPGAAAHDRAGLRRPAPHRASSPPSSSTCLVTMTREGLRPRDIVTPASPAQRGHGGDGHGRLDQRRAARRRDRARRGPRLLGGRDEPGRVQRAVAPAARRRQHAAVRGLFDGRHRREWAASPCVVKRAARRRLPRRDHPYVHGRDPRRAGAAARPAGARRRGRLPRARRRSSRRAACASCAATSRPRAARSSRSPASRAASWTGASPAGPACSTASER